MGKASDPSAEDPDGGKPVGEHPAGAALAAPGTASEWLVALAETPDDGALHARFDAWLAASPANALDWEEMSRTVALMGMTLPVHRHVWDNAAGREPPPAAPIPFPTAPAARRRPGWRLGMGLAAAALAAGILPPLFPGLMTRLDSDYRTGTAELQSVRLGDGTLVRLAPESAIGVAFTAERRQVRLLKGEAFFEIAQEARRPFVVATGTLETTDIGTSFGVRMDGAGAEVSVRDGIVRIDGPKAAGSSGTPVSERLTAGEQVRVAWNGGAVERGRLPPQQVASWTHGQLVVKQRRVTEVVDALRPYYHGLILLRDKTLAEQPLTGVYNLSDPVGALQAVAAAQGATLHRISPWLIVLSMS